VTADALRAALMRELGAAVQGLRAISGGDINDAYRVTLGDGRTLFVKTQARPLPGMFACEARGLGWLAEAGALRTPGVIAFRDEAPAFLALELIERAAPGAHHDEQLGRGLAALHRAGAPSFGLDHDNYLATLPQPNGPASAPGWAAFYAERRLEPLFARAVDAGLLGSRARTLFAPLLARLPELCGPAEPPARLHGDLWGGNAIADERGRPVLIDPAVYGGHREIDLAMMQLFGGFGPRCFAAYDEAYPRAAGHEERVPLYQLYPLLVHVNLFGTGYAAGVERALLRYA
jgi:fructosamine-3-kinase